MIIGLLIGGILKGQELIANARITSTIRQIDSYRAATLTFQDAYGAIPGDIANAGTRLPDCGATPVADPCNTAGNSNGLVDANPYEIGNFWRHLAKANMISGVDASLDNPSPKAALGNSSTVYALGCNYLQAFSSGSAIPSANCLYFENSTYGFGDAGGSLSPKQAAQMDRKVDDGRPWYGSFRGENTVGSILCATGGGTTYNETVASTTACFIGTAL
jgi:hypothetical protein